MSATQYRCPACGFRIFNRRVARCESCSAPLPAELLLSRDERAALDAQHEKSKKEREARARAGRDDGGVSGDVGSSWDFGGDSGAD